MYKSLLLPVLFFVTASSAQNYVTLYEDCNYSGKMHYLEPGNYRLYQMKIDNDKLSCLNIPYGMKVTIYENDNYSGKSKTFSANVACLDALWNDMASSIVVESDYNQYNQNDYVVFYNDCYSKGYSQTLRPGRYTGTQLGTLRNNISSFTIYGNLSVKAYINNDNLSGYSYTHTTSESCLGNSENDKISSLIIEYRSNYNNNNPNNNNNSNNYATIYTDCNYRGNSLRLSPGYYQGDKLGLLKYDISSIEIPSNLRAKVYLNNDYLNGTYYTLSENTSCLSNTLNNKIGSLIIEDVGTTNNNYQQPGNDKVIIYTDTDYKGQSVSLLPGTYSTMSQVNFPDNSLSSLTVPDGYRVVIYEFENFGGKTYTITESKTRFYLSGWNDKTSSIAVYRDR
jgi:hypothetical protein